jgi:hypothetical protein
LLEQEDMILVVYGDTVKLTRKIKKVQDELRSKVQADYRYEIQISVREEPGPFGLKVIVACNPKAHPGTGMKRVLMDDEDGITYGVHGEKTVADLCRLRGWSATPPDAKTFLKLINQACFEGIGKFAEADSKFVTSGKTLEFHCVRIEHPSGKRIPVVLKL